MKTAFLLAVLLIAIHPVGSCRQNSARVDTTVTIRIGGIQQVIRLVGKDASKPILLYLHGAGGNNYSLIGNADKFTAKLQQNFVVALWDQRDYGKTFLINHSTQPLTLALIEQDTKEVVDYLLQKFDRKKLFIAGHSQGSVLGMYIAYHFPGLVQALVEMSPPVNGIESQRIAVGLLKAHYQKVNNTRAIEELSLVKLPAKDFESLFIKYIWQTEYDGEHISDSVREMLRPMLKQWMESSAAALSNEVFELDFARQFPSVKCPVYFFAGRKDLVTNAGLTEQYFKQLKAPVKRLYWFENSAHNIPDTEPALLQEIIIDKVLKENK